MSEASTQTSGVDMTPTYKIFNVKPDVFRRFETGRVKFERWSKFLDKDDPDQCKIYDYACKNRTKMVVLRDESTGAMRGIRRRSNNAL